MTAEELEDLFEKHHEEHSKSKRIPKERRLSHRDDLNAFMILDGLLPPTKEELENGPPDMVCSAEHDKIWLGVDTDELAEAGITEEQIIDLIRCGCMTDCDSLCMNT